MSTHGIVAVTHGGAVGWFHWRRQSTLTPAPRLLQLDSEILEAMGVSWPAAIGRLAGVCKYFRQHGGVRRALLLSVLQAAEAREWRGVHAEYNWPRRRYNLFASSAVFCFSTPLQMQQVVAAAFGVDLARHRWMGARQHRRHAFRRVLRLLIEYGRRAAADPSGQVRCMVGIWCVHVWGQYFKVRSAEAVRLEGPDSEYWREDVAREIGLLCVLALEGLGGPPEWGWLALQCMADAEMAWRAAPALAHPEWYGIPDWYEHRGALAEHMQWDEMQMRIPADAIFRDLLDAFALRTHGSVYW